MAAAISRSVSICLALAALGASTAGAAQTVPSDQRIAFDIPAQSLDGALAQYFRATGVQLLYDSTLTRGRTSGTVQGNYAPREALRLLLRGTGLIARYSRSNAAIITAPDTASDTPLVPLGRIVVREKVAPSPRLTAIERLEYYGRLSEELEAYLRNDKRTAGLSFHIMAAIRIAADGQLAEFHVERGSGREKIDRLLAETLSDRTVSPPPQGVTQPLLVSLKGSFRKGD